MFVLRAASNLVLWATSGMLVVLSVPGGAAAQSRPVPSKSSGVNNPPPASSSVEVINGTSRVIKNFNAPTPVAPLKQRVRTETAGTRVEVINGEADRTVILNAQPEKRETAPAFRGRVKGSNGKRESTAPALTTAEIFNGTRRETRVFGSSQDAFDGAASALRVRPVVIGVASSTSAPVVIGIAASGQPANPQTSPPVVIRVTSSGSESEAGTTEPVVVGIESSGIAPPGAEAAEPVAISIAPRPSKRPPYRRPTPNP
jgi:hypothetical protein